MFSLICSNRDVGNLTLLLECHPLSEHKRESEPFPTDSGLSSLDCRSNKENNSDQSLEFIDPPSAAQGLINSFKAKSYPRFFRWFFAGDAKNIIYPNHVQAFDLWAELSKSLNDLPWAKSRKSCKISPRRIFSAPCPSRHCPRRLINLNFWA